MQQLVERGPAAATATKGNDNDHGIRKADERHDEDQAIDVREESPRRRLGRSGKAYGVKTPVPC